MGFDAGSIVAHMVLTRDDFNEGVDEVKAKGQEIEDSPIVVEVGMTAEEFAAEGEEVQAIKAELGQPIEIDVNLNDPELDAEAADAIAAIEAVRAAAAEPITAEAGVGTLPTELRAAADELSNTFAELGAAADRAGGQGLVQSLIDAGVGEEELVTALRGLGLGKTEAQGMIAEASAAAEVAALEAAQLRNELIQTYVTGIFDALQNEPLALGSGVSGEGAILPSIDPLLRSMLSSPDWERVLDELPSASRGLPAVLGTPNWELGGGTPAIGSYPFLASILGGQPALGTGAAGGGDVIDAISEVLEEDDFAERLAGSIAGTERLSAGGGLTGFAGALLNGGLTADEVLTYLGGGADAQAAVTDAMRQMANAYSDAALAAGDTAIVIDDFSPEFGRGAADLVTGFMELTTATRYLARDFEGATGSGGIGGALSKALGGFATLGGKLSSAIDGFGPGSLNSLTALLSPSLIPLLGAVGGAAGGALAGTAIGGAGTLWALIPGLLDLMKGYSAYTALKSGTTTALSKLPSGALGVGNALGGLIGSGSGFLGGLETSVYPQIIQFLDALTTALPAIAPFAETAVTAMSRFFTVIDKGLDSSGFKSFMSTMTKDLGPIMTDFGQVIENLGGSFGNFLEIFGGPAAQAVGGWFVRVTTDLTKFLSHTSLSAGFLKEMTTAFHSLGAILHTVWTVLTLVGTALEPLGAGVLKTLGTAFTGLDEGLHDLPKQAATVIEGIAVALGAIVILTNPIVAVAAAFVGLGLAIKSVHKPDWTLTTIIGAARASVTTPKKLAATTKALLARAEKTGAGLATLQAYGRELLAAQKAADRTADQTRLSGVNGPVELTYGHGLIGPAAPPTVAPTGAAATRAVSSLSPQSNDVYGTQIWQKIDNNFIHPLVHGLTTTIPHAFEGLGGYIGTWATGVGQHFVSSWDAIDDNFVHPLVHFFTTEIPAAFTHLGSDIAGWATTASTPFTTAWDAIDDNFVHPFVHFFTTDIPDDVEKLPSILSQAWSSVEGTAVAFWHDIDNDVLHPIETFFVTTIPSFLAKVPGFFSTMWGHIKSGATTFWDDIDNDVLKPIENFFTKTIPKAFTAVVTFFRQLPSEIAKAASGMGSALLTAGKDLVNGLITGIDQAINDINSHIPSVFGVKLFPSIPDIPKLATGGAFGPGLHLVGEAGPELVQFGASGAVTPYSTLRTMSIGSGGSNVQIAINVTARGATNEAATRQAVTNGITQTLPRLRAALERGAA